MAYKLFDLAGYAPDGSSVARALSEQGRTVGYTSLGSFADPPPKQWPEGFLQLHSVSSDGQLAVGESKQVSDWKAVLVELDAGRLRPLGEASRCLGVNVRGEAVGRVPVDKRTNLGFLWRDGQLEVVPESLCLLAINDQSQAVGLGLGGPALFLEEQPLALEPPADFEEAAAYGLSPDGRLVAGACRHQLQWQPCLWTRQGEGFRVELLEPGRGGVALGVNDQGRVVGYAFERPPMGFDRVAPWAVMASARVQAFEWAGGGLCPLQVEGTDLALKVATGINARGQVVGWGVSPSTPRLKRAFRLDPTQATRVTVRPARPDELDCLLELLPRLAAFDLPPRRLPQELWQGDADMLRAWARGYEPQCACWLALDESAAVVGCCAVRLRPELLSQKPSAHLELLAVGADNQGKGVGQALMQAAESWAREQGAVSMSLHVFANNQRARRFY
ncbi:MAG: GNAT family N-acetyltransferase, partial [Candidatus Eremiobacteraeota bacterium]|nr:GNAT family N-acetyltransferase [Candidatus Eremiobacteraeota bacterium]